MKLKVIVPVVLQRKDFKEEILKGYKSISRSDVEMDIVSLDQGPESIESKYDEALSQPGVLEKIQEAEKQSFDACLIDCFGDPALYAAREVVHIPVVGVGQSGMLLAAMIGRRFSVITVLDRIIPLIEDNAQVYGVSSKLASVRSVDIPVLDLKKDRDLLIQRLIKQAELAIKEDGADVIVLGCTGMAGLAGAVKEGLYKKELKVPVIDPVKAAVKFAESLVDLGLSQSLCYVNR